ncbi:hypothetical protein B0J15DRAFT_403709, partial [Fusarium solani]
PKLSYLMLKYLEKGGLEMYMREEHVPPEIRQCWGNAGGQSAGALHVADVVHCDVMPRSFELNAQLKVSLISRGAIIS